MQPIPNPTPDTALAAINHLIDAIRYGDETRDIIRRIAHHWPNFPHRSHGLLLQRIKRAKAATSTNVHSRHFLEPVQAMQAGGAYLLAFQGKTATVYLLVQSDEAIDRHSKTDATSIYRITKR